MPDRIEPPEWYRHFHPEAWAEPDALELSMGNIGEAGRRRHQERRWGEAQHAYRRAHPAFGTQEFRDLMARVQARYMG